MNRSRLIMAGWILFAILSITAAVYIYFNERGIMRYTSLRAEVDSLRHQVGVLEQEKTTLRNAIDSLEKSIPHRVEKVSREQYGLKRDNEKVFKVIIK